MAEISYSTIQRTSRISAVLTAIGSLIVLVSLYSSYRQTQKAKQELDKLEYQTRAKRVQKDELEKEVSRLSKQAQAYSTVLNDVVSTNPQAAKTVARSAESSPSIAQSIPRLFVHSRDSNNLALAETLARNLRSQGFIVSAPDILSSSFDPTKAETVFFGTNAATQQDLQAIAKALIASGVSQEAIAAQQDIYNKHPPRTYAVYLPLNTSGTRSNPDVETNLQKLTNRELAAKAEDLAERISGRMHRCFDLRDAEGSEYNRLQTAKSESRPLEQQEKAQQSYRDSEVMVESYVKETRTIYAAQVTPYAFEIERRLYGPSAPFTDPMTIQPKYAKDCDYPTALGTALNVLALKLPK